MVNTKSDPVSVSTNIYSVSTAPRGQYIRLWHVLLGMLDLVALPRDRDNGTSAGSSGGGFRGTVEGLVVHDRLRQEYGEHLARGDGSFDGDNNEAYALLVAEERRTGGERRRRNALRGERDRRRTQDDRQGLGASTAKDIVRVGAADVGSRQRQSPPVESETDSRFKFDRSVARIAMTGSVEKRRESTAEVKAAMV